MNGTEKVVLFQTGTVARQAHYACLLCVSLARCGIASTGASLSAVFGASHCTLAPAGRPLFRCTFTALLPRCSLTRNAYRYRLLRFAFHSLVAYVDRCGLICAFSGSVYRFVLIDALRRRVGKGVCCMVCGCKYVGPILTVKKVHKRSKKCEIY